MYFILNSIWIAWNDFISGFLNCIKGNDNIIYDPVVVVVFFEALKFIFIEWMKKEKTKVWTEEPTYCNRLTI